MYYCFICFKRIAWKKLRSRIPNDALGTFFGQRKFYTPDELRIVETFNFDDRTNPSYSSILHVIETNDGETGYSLDAYGALKNYKSSAYDFVSKIPSKEKDQELVF